MEIWCDDEEVYEKVKITAYPDRRMIPSKDFIFLNFNMQIACRFGPFVVFVEDINYFFILKTSYQDF